MRLTAEAIAALTGLRAANSADRPPHTGRSPNPVVVAHGSPASATLVDARTALIDCAAQAANWYSGLADALSRTTRMLPAAGEVRSERDLLTGLHPAADILQQPAVARRARTLWAASLFLDDVTRLQTRLHDALADRSPTTGMPR